MQEWPIRWVSAEVLEIVAETPRVTTIRLAVPGWRGYTRRIDREMLLEVLTGPDAQPLAYICGPTPMVESTTNPLVSLGYTPERVLTERFGPTGGSSLSLSHPSR